MTRGGRRVARATSRRKNGEPGAEREPAGLPAPLPGSGARRCMLATPARWPRSCTVKPAAALCAGEVARGRPAQRHWLSLRGSWLQHPLHALSAPLQPFLLASLMQRIRHRLRL